MKMADFGTLVIIGMIIIVLAVMFGSIAEHNCYSSLSEATGIVTHDGSLAEAYSKCREKCYMIYDRECEGFLLQRSGEELSHTPRLSECTDRECQCEC